MKLRRILPAALLLFAVACTDDSGPSGLAVDDCPAGTVFNAISGQCVATDSKNPNGGNTPTT
jgi:hypothetical protein